MLCNFCQENVRGTPCQSNSQAAKCINNRDNDWPDDNESVKVQYCVEDKEENTTIKKE